MQHIREHEFADILGMVSEMRSHRLSMVQTEVSSSPLRGPAHHVNVPPRGVFITSPVLTSNSSSSVQEQYVFIHQCVLLMWQKKKQQSITSDVIYENASKT